MWSSESEGLAVQPEQYEIHAVWTVLDSIHDLLNGDLQPCDDDSRYDVRRLQAAAEFADGLRDIDPVLVEPQGLVDLQSHLQGILNALNTYASDPERQRNYLQAAASNVPNVLSVGRSYFPWAQPDEAARAVKAAATRYKNSLDSEVERLIERIDDLEAQLAQAKESRATAEQAAQTRLAELAQTVEARGADVDAIAERAEALTTSQEVSYQKEAQTRDTKFQEWLKQLEDAEKARVAEAAIAEEERLAAVGEADEAARKARDEEAKALIAALEDYRDQAKALVDTTSRHAVAGEYESWAARQAKAAIMWTIAAVVIGLGTVAGLVVAIGSASDDSLQFTLYKTSISIIGLIIAGYAARQASEHRREERTAKRLALDLAALGPFLEHVEDAEPLRQAVAMRVFAPEPGEIAGDGDSRLRIRGRSMTIGELVEFAKVVQGGGP